MNKFKILLSYLMVVVFSVLDTNAQIVENTELFNSLKQQDHIFFEKGFNQCDLEYLENHIAEDLKFYHDQSGFQDKPAFLENTKEYICSNIDKKPIRKVVENSLQVFPLYDNGKLYGAIQKGEHDFYIRESGKQDLWTSSAKFTHVWLIKDDKWILSEVLSFDHHAPSGNPENANEIDQILVKSGVPALGLGVIENGKFTKIEVYGTLDKHKKAPYNTIFKVASLTKPIVAMTVLKMVDNGLLDLNEPLYKYWIDPDIKGDERYKKLTPYLVLTHQTGFPNWRYLTNSQKLSFQFEPGEKYQYSGEGFEYLRKAIENKMGRTIEELSNEYLFKPLGMHDTRFWWDDAMDRSRYARNFDKNGKLIETQKYYEANAAANLLTTIEDYGKFLEHVINGAGLSENLFQKMKSYQVKLGENDFFGLGWEILSGFSNDEIALLHTGKDPGVSTLAIMFPKSKNGYVIFLNGDNVNDAYEYLLTKKLYLGDELWGKR
jgi:CubicO group peptidase (beta-lactamase class C family)